jgi:nucleoside-diphosphate-sugar epimerase
MRSVTVIGGEGFVGSAFVRRLRSDGVTQVTSVTRANYRNEKGRRADVVVDCSGNSRKFLAEERPVDDFDQSVAQRLRTLSDFPADLQVHISSVDVYAGLDSTAHTREDIEIDVASTSNYGFHKLLAEEVVRHYASRWLIVRLAGMVGPGLKKNPVYDILHGQPLRIHPDSRYQFLHTDDAARLVLALLEAGTTMQVYNVCGVGLISPRVIGRLAERELDLSLLNAADRPRVVDVNLDKLQARMAVPATEEAVRRFVQEV